jgi:hypothetical protein
VDVFTDELKHIGIIHIGGAGDARRLFSTVLHLVKLPPDAAGRKSPSEPLERR